MKLRLIWFVVVFGLLTLACGQSDRETETTRAEVGAETTSTVPTTALATPTTQLATFVVESAEHVEGPIEYPQSPPAGGPHNPVFLDCGFYSTPVSNENAVHSLEHGSVWITFDPALLDDTEAMAALRSYGDQSEVIVSPYPGLDSPVVATAWGVQALFPGIHPQIQEFIDKYHNTVAPESVILCLGGVGEPD